MPINFVVLGTPLGCFAKGYILAASVYMVSRGKKNVLRNVYTNYDLESGEPEKALTVLLVCGDGHEFEFAYQLTAAELGQLREKMTNYCQSQTEMSLENYRQDLLLEEPLPE